VAQLQVCVCVCVCVCIYKERTHHLAIVGVERLLDKRKVLPPKATLQQQQMGKYPRFVLFHKQKHCVPYTLDLAMHKL